MFLHRPSQYLYQKVCIQTIIIMKRKLKCIGFVALTRKLNHESTEVLFYAFKDFLLMSFLFFLSIIHDFLYHLSVGLQKHINA